jgi:hypothetical protein
MLCWDSQFSVGIIYTTVVRIAQAVINVGIVSSHSVSTIPH